MSTCPHCLKPIDFVPPAERNLESYGGSVLAKTTCCGNIVRVSIRYQFCCSIPFNHNELTEDDWGNKKSNRMGNENIKKALYKEKPKAIQTGLYRDGGSKDYETKLEDGTIVKFHVPISEQQPHHELFTKEMEAYLLIRWIINETNSI